MSTSKEIQESWEIYLGKPAVDEYGEQYIPEAPPSYIRGWRDGQAALKNNNEDTNEWKPIETAPKGEVFLAFSPSRWGGSQSIACFITDALLKNMMTGKPLDDQQVQATHWMRIPNNPS